MHDHLDAKQRARLSLQGLSVGDALGECFFGYARYVIDQIRARALPSRPWSYTDDTEMALSIVEVLFADGHLDPDHLAAAFARRFDVARGYGAGAYRILLDIQRGVPWHEVAPSMFGGSGSFGNGAAMRVAPLGAFFADDLDDLVEAAARSARVTHAHPEGVAGAIAVALAAALAYRGSLTGKLGPKALFSAVLERTPESVTRARIEEASRLAPTTSIPDAAYLLGSGDQVSAQDTVPFVLWSAAHHLGNYKAAF